MRAAFVRAVATHGPQKHAWYKERTRPRVIAPAVDVAMNFAQVSRLADHLVLPGLVSVVTQGRANTSETLAYIAVADERRLFAAAGYPSMYQYCLGELHLCEGSAYKHIQAARAARQFPAIFEAVEQDRLHLSAVVILAPSLNLENAADLLVAATHRTRAQIELLLSERFPQPDLATLVQPVMPASSACQLSPGTVGMTILEHEPTPGAPSATPFVPPPPMPGARTKVTPLAPQRYGLQFTVGKEAHELLLQAQALLGHAVPTGDVGEVFLRAMRLLVQTLEKQRCAATSHPRPRRGTTNARHVPADVRRKVWKRDGGQCTFVSDKGHRCEARTKLEFDHVTPVARGGTATVDGMRLRCRAHNQYAAECAFGAGFMQEKRDAAKARAAETRQRRTVAVRPAATVAAQEDPDRDLAPWLRRLGCRPDEIRAAIARCEAIPEATLEERMRHALRGLGPRGVRRSIPMAVGLA